MSLLVSNLTVERRGRTVLRNVSFEARQGRVLVVMGPNGAGKTTLLGAIGGLLRPADGRIAFAGQALHLLRPEAMAVWRAYMAQHFETPFAYGVEDIVGLGRLCHAGTSRAAQDEAAIASALARADLKAFAGRAVTTLSGGERQRVAFAKALAQIHDRALSGKPHLVILDEPVSSLDPEHQHRLLGEARKLAGGGATVVVTLHDLTLASIHGDDVLLLDRGGAVAHGAMAATLTPALIRQVFKVEVASAPQEAGEVILHAIAQSHNQAV
ncbi:ATP-binding cassette domain-containing protein [Labrys okinawensis]|uniref:ATP-binding cassette domain-containing protein n=1 Tax=Labrys okinawensis TaxID=346911 RepID=UPI0039BD10F5